VRGKMTLVKVIEKRPGEFLLSWDVSVEIESEEKPALSAQWLTMAIVSA
jgi:hypothetical protein